MAEAEEDSDSHSIAGPRAGLFPGLRRPTRPAPRCWRRPPRVSRRGCFLTRYGGHTGPGRAI